MDDADTRYFERIESQLDAAIAVARTARERGGDPTPGVEIPVAQDMADRVENLLGIDGIARRVRELEADPDVSREEAALELAADFAEGRVGADDSRAGRIEGAVRTAVALLTEGVVAAPIEGIDRVEVLTDDDGSEFVRVFYAGPIRSAGGTAQALSVLVADYVRTLVGLDAYRPRENEVERYVEELSLYDDETGLQYTPTAAETRYIARHCPVMLDGEPTGDAEVSGYRDVDRVDTNNPRGGMCLVLGEGIAQKAPKIQRYTARLAEVDWPWLEDLIDGEGEETDPSGVGATGDPGSADGAGSPPETAERPTAPETPREPSDGGPPRVPSSKKFLRDLIAGRPVFAHPSEPGGFRLRYGRARNHGFATAGVHPATMHLVDDFLATGTQLKTELPGKAAGVVPVDSIEGPTVRLANGAVRRIDDPAEAREVRNGVEAILDLGEYLVNYGEFVENNHPLAPASYVQEWWGQDMAAAGADVQALRDAPRVDLQDPSVEQALEWARKYDAPLHPVYTYLWHDLSVDEFEALADAVADGRLVATDGTPTPAGEDRAASQQVLSLDATPAAREALEVLLVEHRQGENIVIPEWRPLVASLGLDRDLTREWTTLSSTAREWPNAMRAVREVAPFEIRERAPTRVGCRMGRPEKSETRELSPPVHTLFPIGPAGGDQRDVGAAANAGDGMDGDRGRVVVRVARRQCTECGTRTYRARCQDCNGTTNPVYECPDCERPVDPDGTERPECPRCEIPVEAVKRRPIDVNEALSGALSAVDERESSYDILKGVKGLTSAEKIPEPLEKGVLRAKNGVSVFKDGTVRYDMTDLPVTAVRPAELDVSADRFRELGYREDVDGQPLTHDDQLVELKVQDVVLSEGAAAHMVRTADFVDDLLTEYYGLESFYEIEDRQELVGELVFGLAPHTSAAVVGRVVGFTAASVGYAHPYFHAAKRRNCLHPDTRIWYEENGRWYRERIRTVVEDRLEDPREDRDGTLVQRLDEPMYVPSLDARGQPVHQPVEALSKHPAPDHLIQIETRSGRRLRVTPDHAMLRIDDGLERVPAHEIAAGDELPMPKTVDPPGRVEEFDLLVAFVESNAVSNQDLMIRGLSEPTIERLFTAGTSDEGSSRAAAQSVGRDAATVSDWMTGDSVPAAVLLELYSLEELAWLIPEDVQLAFRHDPTAIDRQFTVDEDVCRLLGHYVAEGFTRCEPGGSNQMTIYTEEDRRRSDVRATVAAALSVDIEQNDDGGMTVPSRLVAVLVTDVLGLGDRASTKAIPPAVLTGSRDGLRQFLSAYFSADWSASSDRREIRAHTVSARLKDDLVDALRRFDITPKVSLEARRPPGEGEATLPAGERPDDRAWVLTIPSSDTRRFADAFALPRDRPQPTGEQELETRDIRPNRRVGDGGGVWRDAVASVEAIRTDEASVYCLTVSESHSLVANDLYTGQCDGDEDSIMLLMDGLLNFSRSFLPDRRGGRMDAPLVMSSRIDPTEIDDEAHNMDVVQRYPRPFYEATRRLADPGEVDIETAAASLGTASQYRNFGHTHETGDIAAGPALSAYKTLGSMMAKMDAQLALARKLRAVDETDVAERVIEYHFLPDLIGNLRAFSRQETRCLDCGEKFRRMPLSGSCRACGGNVTLTVHEGSVDKYLEPAVRVAVEYGCREYTKQRLEILRRSIESIFEDDTNKQSGIADFM